MGMMIDPNLIPPDIWPPAKVRKLNDLLGRLESRKVAKIKVPEPGTRFRAGNTIMFYCQAHIQRCLTLTETAYTNFFNEDVLVALMCARAVYETVANFVHVEKQLQEKIATGDIQAIFEFVKAKTHATKAQHLIDQHGEQVKAVNILTQIDKLAKLVRPRINQEYEFLSELVHPNSFGAALFYADFPRDSDEAIFRNGGPDPRADLQWILVATDLLYTFEEALERIEAQLPELSRKGREQSPHIQKS
jgi:hypothetical protein